MAIGDDYATLAELKEHLDITDSTGDALLQIALTSASRGIEDFCGRQFNTDNVAVARTFRPLGRHVVYVDDFHTTTGLVVETDEDDDGTFERAWTSSDYELRPLNALRHGEAWPYWQIHALETLEFPCARRTTVQVTAQWGWAAVPASVKEACLLLAAETFKLKSAPFGVAGYGDFGPIRVRKNPMASAMLMPYARDRVRVA